MTAQRNKEIVDNIWRRYEQTLKLLVSALEELAVKPKEIIKEKIVYRARPGDERLHVNTINLAGDQAEAYENKIKELEKKIQELTPATPTPTPNMDYWGRPKASTKEVDDANYEKRVEKKFARILKEVKAGSLDINTLNNQEQEIIRRMLNNE